MNLTRPEPVTGATEIFIHGMSMVTGESCEYIVVCNNQEIRSGVIWSVISGSTSTTSTV